METLTEKVTNGLEFMLGIIESSKTDSDKLRILEEYLVEWLEDVEG